MNILVIRLSSMGDVVLASSTLEYLHTRYPDGHLHFVTNIQYREFFDDDPRLSALHLMDESGDVAGLEDIVRIRWDRIVDLQNNRRSRRLRSRLAVHAPTSVLNKLHTKRLLLLIARLDTYDPACHVAVRYARAAGGENVLPESVPPASLYVAGNPSGVLRDMFGQTGGMRPVLALIPFSAWRNKQWPLEYYRIVGSEFVSRGFHVAVLGGPEDTPASLELAQAIGQGCVSCAGRMGLKRICELLSGCCLALGGDTGLSHAARACGVRTGIVYGATTRQFGFFPFGSPQYRVFEMPLFCRPCHPHGGDMCWRVSRPCLRNVSPDMVIDGLVRLNQKA